MIPTKPAKGQYSEAEAAAALGLTVDQLRTLIRHHIVEQEEDLAHLASANFQPSDLLVLRMILDGQVPLAAASEHAV